MAEEFPDGEPVRLLLLPATFAALMGYVRPHEGRGRLRFGRLPPGTKRRRPRPSCGLTSEGGRQEEQAGRLSVRELLGHRGEGDQVLRVLPLPLLDLDRPGCSSRARRASEPSATALVGLLAGLQFVTISLLAGCSKELQAYTP